MKYINFSSRSLKLFLVFSLFYCFGYSQNKVIQISPIKVAYKKIDTISLNLHIYKPLNFSKDSTYNCILFFHGGAWNNGSPKSFHRQAMYFASRGIIAISTEYRINSKHSTTPFEAVEDAKSAMRYLRKHAQDLNINPNMIAAGGGSAGGHLAAACALIEGLDNTKEDLTISTVPNALVLLNPVIDNGPDGGFGYNRFKNRYKEISPIHNITKNAPPTIILNGTKDEFVPVKVIDNYKSKMEAVGSRCDVIFYEGVGHAFFAKPPTKYFVETTYESDLFLISLGFLKAKPTIKEQYSIN